MATISIRITRLQYNEMANMHNLTIVELVLLIL